MLKLRYLHYLSKYVGFVCAIPESESFFDSVAEGHGGNVGTFFADVKLLDQMFHKLDLGGLR